METEINLSKRLKKVASFVSAHAFLADIGSDHAYLPAYICQHDQTIQAIAGEVRKGPFLNAKRTVEQYELIDRIDVRLGSGLEVIDSRVTEITIAGMGGSLIASILDTGKKQLKNIQKIIAQPNNQEHLVRKKIYELQFVITDEVLMEENGHMYEIIVAERKNVSSCYNDTFPLHVQHFFGPCLLKEKSPLFIEKWNREKEAQYNILNSIQQAKVVQTEKEVMIKQQIQMIEEVALS